MIITPKEFAIAYVGEHDRLTLDEKKMFCDFIIEASDDQINYLLTTGMMKSNLTEDDKKLITEGLFGDLDAMVRRMAVTSYDVGKSAGHSKGFEIGHDMGYHSGEKAGRAAGHASGQVSGAIAGVAATIIVAAAVVVAVKVYKRHLSKAATACKEKAGLAKTSCMNKYKNDAIKQKIQALQTLTKACEKSKKPQVCKAKMQQKINTEKSKLGDY